MDLNEVLRMFILDVIADDYETMRVSRKSKTRLGSLALVRD